VLELYLVTDTALCGGRGVVETVRAALRGGVSAVQVREPAATTRELCALTIALREVLDGTGVPLIVNDRVDVALVTGADGVHLGQDDLDPARTRALANGLLVGLSVRTLAEAEAAATLPAGTVDYLGVGPVLTTATKTDAAPPLGLESTAAAVAATRLPTVAIGGIDALSAPAVRRTGVDGVAVVSAICAAADPAAAAASLRGGPR